MLRLDNHAHFFRDRGAFLFQKRLFFVATGCPPSLVSEQRFQYLRSRQADAPVPVREAYGRTWWWFDGEFCWENEGYGSKDVMAVMRQRERQKQRNLDRAHDLLTAEANPETKREPVTRDVRRAVWERDGGKCVECQSTFDLQYDHIIPVAMGGATTIGNLQILCSSCNQAKRDSL